MLLIPSLIPLWIFKWNSFLQFYCAKNLFSLVAIASHVRFLFHTWGWLRLKSSWTSSVNIQYTYTSRAPCHLQLFQLTIPQCTAIKQYQFASKWAERLWQSDNSGIRCRRRRPDSPWPGPRSLRSSAVYGKYGGITRKRRPRKYRKYPCDAPLRL